MFREIVSISRVYYISSKIPISNKLIGLRGKAGSGKSVTANIFVKKYGYVEYSMAMPLKLASQSLFGFNDQQVFGDAKDVIDSYWGVSPRFILQRFGTEIIREQLPKRLSTLNLGPSNNLHITLFDRWIKAQPRNTKVVVSDVRFDDEAQYIIDNGGILIDIERKSNDICIEDSTHKSERENFRCKGITLINNGTVRELVDAIASIYKVDDEYT